METKHQETRQAVAACENHLNQAVGYAQEKYTKAYFLRRDEAGNPTAYGVMGVEAFEKGEIRNVDQVILSPLDFKGKTLLELGFGRGEAIKYALQNGAKRVVGVDFSEDAAAIARQFLQRHGLTAEIICADALDYIKRETSTGCFDLVLLLDVIEHIPRAELANLLKEMHRVLRPKSVIVVNTPVFGADNDVIADGLNPRARDESDDYPETAGMHCNRYTKGSLRRFMRANGFEALGGHYFANNFARPLLSRSDERVWQKARAEGYPLAAAVKPVEHFEIAYSTKQQERLRRLPPTKIGRWKARILPLLWRLGVEP